MSHTITSNTGDQIEFVQLVIQNYTAGGETVLPSELVNVKSIDAVFFATVPAGQNSLGTPLFPVLSGGNIMLFHFVSGAPVEIPTTSNLNATVSALVHISVMD